MVEAAGIEPLEAATGKTTPTPQSATNSRQNNTLGASANSDVSHKTTPSEQADNKFQQLECVPRVYENQLPDDLALIVAVWPELSDGLKRKIFALVGLTNTQG